MSRRAITPEERERLRELVRDRLAVEPSPEMDALFRRRLAMAQAQLEGRPAPRRLERWGTALAERLLRPAPALIAAAVLLLLALVWIYPAPGRLESSVGRRAWAAGSVIEVGPEQGSLPLRFGRAYGMLLEPDSRLEIVALPGRRRAGQSRFLLHRGQLTVATGRRFPGSTLQVELGRGSARVVGTAFQAARPGAQEDVSEIRVEEGTVEVITVGAAAGRALAAGQYARIGGAGAVETGAMPPLGRRQLRAALAALAAGLGQQRPVPEIELNIAEQPARVLELLVPCDLVYDSRGGGPIVALLDDARRQLEAAADGPAPAVGAQALATLWRIVNEHSDPRINTAVLLYLAACAHDLGETQQALDALGRILEGEPESPLIPLAFAAKACILERSRRVPEALAVWRELARLYPRSPDAAFAQNRIGTPQLPGAPS